MLRSRTYSIRAFTLLEIMLVVMIIALLAGTAIHFLRGNWESAARIAAETDIKHVKIQLGVYRTMNGSLPSAEQGLQALVTKPTSDPVPRRWTQYLEIIPTDPWQQPYVFQIPPTRSRDKFDLFSKGEDQQANTDDDIGNW